MGPASAPVTIVEFSDYQCPYCATLYKRLERLRALHPVDVAIVYRHVPITALHEHARAAAIASECAGAQGRFREYYYLLFQQPDSIGKIPWETAAQRVGVANLPAFKAYLSSPLVETRLKRDSVAAAALEITGTPTILVNNKRRMGAPTDAALDSMVTEALRDRQRK